jgi:hypothetical protein
MSSDEPTQDVATQCRYETTEQAFREDLSDEELIRCIDAMAHQNGGFIRGIGDYRHELARRGTERLNQRLERLTWVLVALTLVLVVMMFLVWGELRR